jgi:hypothetical protein
MTNEHITMLKMKFMHIVSVVDKPNVERSKRASLLLANASISGSGAVPSFIT